MGDVTADLREARLRMVESQLRARGVRSDAVLDAMADIPREAFLPPERRGHAYLDQAIPISHGQTISQPYMVAVMSEALQLRPEDRVLEIGTGSGYQTAVLTRLAREVYSIERIAPLAAEAKRVLGEIGCENLSLRVGDGTMGWPEAGPFDAILVTAGAPVVPGALRDQLSSDGGRLVVPVGDRFLQQLTRVTRRGTEVTTESLLACRFVPLLGAQGWETPEP